MQMDDTNKKNTLDLTGENQGESPTSQAKVVDNVVFTNLWWGCQGNGN